MRVLALIALLVPAVAEAGHSCHEVSHVVGYQRCSRFGGWARSASFWLEGGVAELRFSPGPLDAIATNTTGTVRLTTATGAESAIVATGGRLRDLVGFRGGYFGSEIDIASFSDGPLLVANGGGPASSSGTVFDAKMVLGYRQMLGPVSLGLEAAPGFRGVTFGTATTTSPTTFQMSGLVEAHAHADLWLSEHWTLGAQVSTDVLQLHDDSIALTLGVHVTPWDGLR